MNPDDPDLLFWNGIDFTTGTYLRPPAVPRELLELWRGLPGRRRRSAASGQPGFAGEGVEHLRRNTGVVGSLSEQFRFWAADIDPEKLETSGWGVIFPHGVDVAIRAALMPLLEHRRKVAGSVQAGLYRELIYRPGESLYAFLERHGVGPGLADPEKMPYFLLIVGSPEEIPFDFQFELDVQYAVGRVSFASPSDYARYAAKVVSSEDHPLERAPRAAFFAARHPGDRATSDSIEDLVKPLFQKLGEDRSECGLSLFVAEEATRQRFLHLLREKNEAPDLLFTSTHGLGLPRDHGRLRELQGALVTSDWRGPATASPSPPGLAEIIAPGDLNEPGRLEGSVLFLHGCFTAGTPRLQTFARKYLQESVEQASCDFISSLAQRLLAMEGGALAVIGHVDKTWTSSFRWRRAGSQIQTYETAIKELLDGKPVGLAMEGFGLRHAELSAVLQSAFDAGQADDLEVAHLWTAHHDARNFIVLGDPAVRLRARVKKAPVELPTTQVISKERLAAATPRPDVSAPHEGLLGRRRPPVQNLDIRVAPASEGGYRCTLSVGAQSKSARIDLEHCKKLGAEIYDRVKAELGEQGISAPPSSLLKEAGAELFEALFSGPLLSFFERTLERSGGRPLRLLVHLDPESRSRAFLSTVPWEWLYWREKQDFLSLNRRTPVLRFVEVDAVPPPEAKVEKLRVLILTSEHEPSPAIRLECSKIQEALAKNRRIEVEVQNGVSLTSLRESFAGEGFEVIHFIGHGLYARAQASAQLVLEEPNGRRYVLSGEDLAQTLRDFGHLRLVFFNSCDTARTDESGYRPFAGVAQALLQNGVPAVIAMQFPISHPAATAFSARFYRALASGESLDAAVAEGRQAIRTQQPDSLEWGTPVLFVRTTTLEILESASSLRWLHWLYAFILAILLALYLIPPPSRADVTLTLSTSFVRFRLAEKAGKIFDRLLLDQLGVGDLAAVEMGSVPIPEGQGPFDLLLSSADPNHGSITLQQSDLPGGSWVAIRWSEDKTYQVSLETEKAFSAEKRFEAVVRGPYRLLVRQKGKTPLRLNSNADPLEALRFVPRGHEVDLDLSFRRYEGREFHPSIDIVGLELFDVVEKVGTVGTEHEAVFRLSGKVEVEGYQGFELLPGSQLRLGEPRGVLQQIRPGEQGLELVFAGDVARIERGPRGDLQSLMPRRQPIYQLFTQLVAILAGIGTVAEFAGFLRRAIKTARRRVNGRERKGQGAGE